VGISGDKPKEFSAINSRPRIKTHRGPGRKERHVLKNIIKKVGVR
jgi:hypothetical protein